MQHLYRWFLSNTSRNILLILAISASRMLPAQPQELLYSITSPAKVAPPLLTHRQKSNPHQLRIRVSDKESFTKWQKQHLPDARLTEFTGDEKILTMSGLTGLDTQLLLHCPAITFIDVADRTPHEEGNVSAMDLAANRIAWVHTYFPALSGTGLVVSVKENPFDPTDIDFKGRIVNAPVFTAPYSAHAATMATLIGGGGNTAPSGKGAAWGAGLTYSNFVELLPDDGQQLSETGVSVQNHSYGVGIENYYGIEAQAYDQQCIQYPQLVHIFSSGNSGTSTGEAGPYAGIPGFANLTGQFKMSKNTISVGATDATGQVAAASSRGPAYDGRLKPELVAYGDGGTSEAAALVSGVSLLLQHAYQTQKGGILPSAALVKSVLLTTADDLGSPGPDFATGFGSVNARRAVQTVLATQYREDNLGEREEKVFRITVPPGMHGLKVTLVWHDPEAGLNAPQALVNDLDLELVHPASGRRWYPWVLNAYPHADSLTLPATRKPDHLNNVEQITVQLPNAGLYELRTKGYRISTGPQSFSVSYAFTGGFTWTYPTTGSTLEAGQAQLLRWDWSGIAATGKLEYQPIGAGDTWTLISNEVALTQQSYSWQAPDTLLSVRLRLTLGSTFLLSDTFILSRPLRLRPGYVCGEESLLYWSPLPGVQQYQVYQLGEQYLEPVQLTTDTLLVLSKTGAQASPAYWAVAPVLQGKPGRKSFSLSDTDPNSNCYIVSFLPDQFVSDTVRLDLQLSTLYQLQSVTLERWTPQGFQPVQTVNPVLRLAETLVDPAPLAGRNRYRIKIEQAGNRTFYSQTEEVFYLYEDDLLVFPNPVRGGSILNIMEETGESVQIRLYDGLGKLLHESTETGIIKTISTDQLAKGVYQIQVNTKSGSTVSRKIVIQ